MLCLVPVKQWRRKLRGDTTPFPQSKAKLGVSYNLFDGEELLEASIKSIRNVVDYIIVGYQKVSYSGANANEEVPRLLAKLKTQGLIDKIYHYNNNFALTPHENETAKRNEGLSLAKQANCTHFMTMDCDEFYKEEELINAYNFILKNDITHSGCPIINYFGKPEYMALNSEDQCAVSFICKILKNSKFKFGSKLPATIDPTRSLCFNKRNDKFYFLTSVTMHHMKYIRKNLRKKIDNSSGKFSKKKLNVKFYESRKREVALSLKLNDNNLFLYDFVKVRNIFNIDLG